MSVEAKKVSGGGGAVGWGVEKVRRVPLSGNVVSTGRRVGRVGVGSGPDGLAPTHRSGTNGNRC